MLFSPSGLPSRRPRLIPTATHLGTEERSGHVDLLATDDNNPLSLEDLLGDDGREPTEEVTLAVNDVRLRLEERHLLIVFEVVVAVAMAG